MNYIDFETSKGTYKLRLNTRSTIALEKLLGGNPLKVFANATETELPPVEQLIDILYCALLAYQPETKKDDVYNIFDEWLEAGNIIAEFIVLAIELYKQAGLIKRDIEKN